MVVSALLGQAADSLDQPIGGAGFQQDAARRCASRTSASVTRGPVVSTSIATGTS